MPKKRLLWTLIAALAFTACNKRTEVSGKITSHDGGKPVEGVKVRLIGFNAIKNRAEAVDIALDSTDANGEYVLCVEDRKIDYVRLKIEKDGYGDPVFFGFDPGESAVVNFTVYPRNAYIDLTIRNTANEPRMLYYSVGGEGYDDKLYPGPLGSGPFVLEGMGTLRHLLQVAGDAEVELIWDQEEFGSKERPNVALLFCPKQDTILYTISL